MMRCRESRRGATTLLAAATLVAMLIGFGVFGANQVGAAHRTMHWLEVNRVLEAAADNAIEEACARFCAAPPIEHDLGPVSQAIQAQGAVCANHDLEVGPVLVQTSALEMSDEGKADGIATIRVRVQMQGGRHPRSRVVEVRRAVTVRPDKSGQSYSVELGDVDLYREVAQ